MVNGLCYELPTTYQREYIRPIRRDITDYLSQEALECLVHEKTQAQARVAELEKRLQEACEAVRAAEDEARRGKTDLDLAERRNAELSAAAAVVIASTNDGIAPVGNDASTDEGLEAEEGGVPASHEINEELQSLKKQLKLAQDELTTLKSAAADVEEDTPHAAREGIVRANVPSSASFREFMESRLEGLRVAVEEEEQESGAQVKRITSVSIGFPRSCMCHLFARGTTLRLGLQRCCVLATRLLKLP